MIEVLADECLHKATIAQLRAAGVVVHWVRELNRRAPDEDVLSLAIARGLVTITVDLDFGELVYRHHRPSRRVVLMRMHGALPYEVAVRLLEVLQSPEPVLDRFTVVTRDEVRRRPLP